jgi:hypothetical protein
VAITQKLFSVTITDPKTHNKPVELPVPRTGIEVKHLERHYEKVEATPVDAPLPPVVDRPFGEAVDALVRLYRVSEQKGNHDLARRAEDAVAALLGKQKHLRHESTRELPRANRRDSEKTLVGVGGNGSGR